MKYSVGVEYALHCLVYLIVVPSNDSIGIKDLAEFQGLPETFLSKVFGKLSKAGIVSSVPGVKGGYRLSKSPKDISFWDVIEAIEGPKPIFQCENIKDNGYLYRKNYCQAPSFCTINLVMLSAEEKRRDDLRNKTLSWLNEELGSVLSIQIREDTRKFFSKQHIKQTSREIP
ncbi:RrF2 family transcriptional regulator [Peribacillus loiseleuriae]|uniref:Transcriptional regulator n=1 Tax=Peribacillus loiseleuriae TaxID=1679170 RepID=A0A0K9GUC7_9BACI|nr:Rrf2 family transcriptional regulator [Peribacillus loiseleuriae]KMY50246.1 transcriptional regulator [Peribacillus loiseleuriae]